MKKVSKGENKYLSLRWYYTTIIIPFVALIIGYIFTTALNMHVPLLQVFFRSTISTFVIWGGCVSIVLYSWKKFPWESMPAKHIVFEVCMILLFLGVLLLGVSFIAAYLEKVTMKSVIQSHSIDIVITSLITFLITVIHEAIFFYKQWKLNFSKSISLEKDNLQASYNALIAQINPHFLFNSLNSLMSLLDNNPKAEQYVQDLSEYLRYVLLSNTQDAVELQVELENLEKYIHLQKLRFGENLNVEFTISEESLKLFIPPLVLQMLFDNCLKHNIVSSMHPLYIKIYDHESSLTVTNNLQKKQTEESTGQGLKNIEGRYRFVAGKAIRITTDDKNFAVTIPLIMSRNDN